MIDINRIRNNKEEIEKELLKKIDSVNLDELLELDEKKRKLGAQLDELRAERKRVSDTVIDIKKSGGDVEKIFEEMKLLGNRIDEGTEEYKVLEEKVALILKELPNIPDPEAPCGKCEADNVVIKCEFDVKDLKDKQYKTHWELGEKLDIFDPERAVKISGSMFSLLKGDGARLLRALIALALDLNREKYTEVIAPHFVTTATLTGTGHLPKFKDDQYKIDGEELWVNPTAEAPLTGMHRNEIFKESELPKRYMAYCVSFRKEAGSAGKDTRGMQRLHEFHKVEMFEICKPDTIKEELNAMVEDAERIIKLLKLPYRILDLCTGDMGDKYARCFDIEVYAPGLDKWLEVSSIGYFTDYQARRSNIKYLTVENKKEYVYTLNGSAMATPRVWAAILENYQNEDGSITVPEVLKPYMGGLEKII